MLTWDKYQKWKEEKDEVPSSNSSSSSSFFQESYGETINSEVLWTEKVLRSVSDTSLVLHYI